MTCERVIAKAQRRSAVFALRNLADPAVTAGLRETQLLLSGLRVQQNPLHCRRRVVHMLMAARSPCVPRSLSSEPSPSCRGNENTRHHPAESAAWRSDCCSAALELPWAHGTCCYACRRCIGCCRHARRPAGGFKQSACVPSCFSRKAATFAAAAELALKLSIAPQRVHPCMSMAVLRGDKHTELGASSRRKRC